MSQIGWFLRHYLKVADYLLRAQAVGLSWPLSKGLDDVAAGATAVSVGPGGNASESAEVHREQLSRVKKTFASAIKRLRPGKAAPLGYLDGIQEHENRVQLSPGKGYLIGNESE